MKNKELKLYNKYKYEYIPNREFIYIGKGNNNLYWFIFKNKNFNMNVNILNNYSLNTKQIIKDLNLKTFINNGNEYIKGCDWCFSNEEKLIHLKPMLKEKLKNIINR